MWELAQVWHILRREVEDHTTGVRVTVLLRRERLDMVTRIAGSYFTGPPVAEAGSEEWLRVEVVYPVVEAVRHLLQFGTDVQIVEPAEARTEMARVVTELTGLYGVSSVDFTNALGGPHRRRHWPGALLVRPKSPDRPCPTRAIANRHPRTLPRHRMTRHGHNSRRTHDAVPKRAPQSGQPRSTGVSADSDACGRHNESVQVQQPLWTPYGDIARLEHLLDEYAP